MKSLICVLLLSLAAYSEPHLDCSVKQSNGHLFVLIEGSEDVKSLKLVTPVDPSTYKLFGPRKILLLWPDELPLYPTLFLKVNGGELHYTPELDRRQLQTTSPDPS